MGAVDIQTQEASVAPSVDANNHDGELTPWPKDRAEYYRKNGLWQNKNLFRILGEKTLSNHLAVIDDRRQLTYSELEKNSLNIARGLQQLGLRSGDKVVVQLPNRSEFLEVVFALLALGAVPIMALPAHREQELKHFCRLSNAAAYVCADQYAGFDYRGLARNLCALTQLKHVIVVGEGNEFYSLDEVRLLHNQAKSIRRASMVKDKGEALALLQLSGGTTNLPKLIPRTHDDYFYSVRESAAITNLTTRSVYLCVLPAAHNFTLSSPGVLGALYAGSTVILTEHTDPERVFPIIAHQRVCTVALVPPLANAWMQYARNNRVDVSSLRVLQVGGAKLNPSTAEELTKVFDCALQQVFGMAEGLVNYTRLHDSHSTICETQGRPISSEDEVLVVDDNDQPLPVGETGHLLTRGPYTIRGYYKAAEHNKTAFTETGFYRTGDLVRLTPEGYIVVEGRAKDQINRGGEKISAAEIEDLLSAHPHVHDVAVVAMPDEFLGEKSCAFIVEASKSNVKSKSTTQTTSQTKPETKPAITLPAIRRYLREIGVAEYKLPDRVVRVDDFPTTKFGKVSKKALREMLV